MKELIGNASNIFLVELEGERLQAQAELILIVSEPSYQYDGAGSFAKIRRTEEIRFSTGIRGIDTLIKQLEAVRDSAKSLEDRATIEPESQP